MFFYEFYSSVLLFFVNLFHFSFFVKKQIFIFGKLLENG